MSGTKKILIGVSALVLVGLGAGGAVLLASHSKPTTDTASKASAATTASVDSGQYKLKTCTSGSTQTIGNANYVVGTDIAPGNYKVTSQTGEIGWTNVNIYNSKQEWVNQGSPSVEQGNADQSFSPQNGDTTVTKLSDGQYMQVDSDPAAFTCE